MQKIFLFFLAITLYSPVCAFTLTPPSASAQVSDSDILIDPNSPEMEQIIKEGEITLKKVRTQQVRQEQKQRLEQTQQTYQEAVTLYRQQRRGPAKDVLGNVEDLMTGYKSTDALLKNIDDQSAEESRRRMQRTRLLEDPQELASLAQQAEDMYQQAAGLKGDRHTALVRKKLWKLKETMEKLKQERSMVSPKVARQLYIQQQKDLIAQKAEKFDLIIFRLTKSKNYSEARKKYLEFQGQMIDDLERLRQMMDSGE